jgi:hypothetical protein
VFATHSTELLRAQGLAVSTHGGAEANGVLLANLSDSRQRIRVGPMSSATAQVSVLDEGDASDARTRPLRHVVDAELEGSADHLELELGAYAIATIVSEEP